VTCLHTNSPGHIWTTLYLPSRIECRSWTVQINISCRLKTYRSCAFLASRATKIFWVALVEILWFVTWQGLHRQKQVTEVPKADWLTTQPHKQPEPKHTGCCTSHQLGELQVVFSSVALRCVTAATHTPTDDTLGVLLQPRTHQLTTLSASYCTARVVFHYFCFHMNDGPSDFSRNMSSTALWVTEQ
jgi:hypothetical protein